MPLNKIQTSFKDLMLDQPDALENLNPDFADHFVKNGISLSRRLAVYRNNIIGSLTDVLEKSFPTVTSLVGEEFMSGMARSFALKNPPAHGCLNSYGAGFADFISAFPPAQSLPYLSDVARLDQAMNDAYYAADETPLLPQDLATIDETDLPDTRLLLAQHVQLLSSPFPLKDLYVFCKDEEANSPPDMTATSSPYHFMIYRSDLDSAILPLTTAEFMMLDALQDGSALGEITQHTLSAFSDFDPGAFLQKFIGLETFCGSGSNESAAKR